MNYLDPETQAELNQKRIFEEIHAIHLAEEATRGRNLFSKALALFGTWLVAYGQSLRRKNSNQRTRYIELRKKPAHR